MNSMEFVSSVVPKVSQTKKNLLFQPSQLRRRRDKEISAKKKCLQTQHFPGNGTTRQTKEKPIKSGRKKEPGAGGGGSGFFT
jgi:hypothetical protein